MDCEMDIPDAKELEWLETNALLPEEEEEDGYMVEDDAGDEEGDLFPIPRSKISDPSAVAENQSLGKRVRLEDREDGKDSGKRTPDEERGTKRRELEDDSDEDWLRYSPPKEGAANVLPEMDHPVEEVQEKKFISRFASEIEGDCMPVTGPSGDRVYAEMSSDELDGGHRKSIRETSGNGLLSVPICSLIKGVEEEALRKVLQESFGSSTNANHSTIPIATEQLWVEKYAPHSFTELLSDEQTNREVLLWLKQWDSCVFGSQIRATTDDVLSDLRRHSSIVHHQKISDNKGFFSKNKSAPFDDQSFKTSNVLDKENNSLNSASKSWSKIPTVNCPPQQKVLLLCGPPGLGKTTLAHVAAKHCGYRVVEINASDERSSSMIESKILDVVQMNSVTADSKPKCLVVDEIDGALGEGKGAVEVILKMLAADKKSTAEKISASQDAQPGKASLKKGQRPAVLLRPVICICNDLYAPALRSLRQVAKVHTFVQPTTSRVVNRLRYICKREGFKTSSVALSTLAEYTECDIRSCLNTLQFLNKKKETLNILEIGSQVVGLKDIARSAFDVWKEVFQKRKLKRERKSMNDPKWQGEFDFLYSLISNRGEYELTMDGIHENFLRLCYHDPMMQKTVKCLDILGVSDSLLRYILRTQHMSLHVYQPPIAITISNLIAQVEKPNIEWPKSLPRCRQLLMERKDLLKIWHNNITPTISRHLSVETFVQDVISPLLHILSPPTLRPVALHLLSEREKNDLAQLVDTMVSYSITYKNSKLDPVQKIHKYGAISDDPVLCLDPPIGEFVSFKDYQSEHPGISLTMKQVLVHEVAKQRILRESIGKSMNLHNGSDIENQVTHSVNDRVIPVTDITTSESVEGGINKLNMTLSKRQIADTAPNLTSEINKRFQATGSAVKTQGVVKRPSRTSSSFFDRFRKGSNKDSKEHGDFLQKAATAERDSRPFLFKYNEGFTNAVKRPVKIRELLL